MQNSKEITASADTRTYWECAKKLVDRVGELVSAEKLYINSVDPEVQDKVMDVLSEYYGGNLDRLNDAIRSKIKSCEASIMRMNIECGINDVNKIKRPDRLLWLLKSKDRRTYYRRAFQRYLRKCEVVSLQTVESDYQKLLAKRATKGS